MRLVTYRKGAAKPRVGAAVEDVVLDLGALAIGRASEARSVTGKVGSPRPCWS